MLWFIIFGVLGFILAFAASAIADKKESYQMGYGFHTFIGVVGACGGAIIAVIANFVACIWIHPVWYKAGEWDLQSIGTSSQTHGSFFLGIGQVDSYPTYNYFAKVGPHDYQEEWAYTDNSTVHESDSTPHVEYWKEKSPNNWLGLFADGSDESYEFYVPSGSVVKTYELKP